MDSIEKGIDDRDQSVINEDYVGKKSEIIQYEEPEKITIGDVADALGISKTTVSRAISGKGRVGAETRQKVLEYIRENHYRPSVVAKGLAQSKTYNIGWVVPGDSSVTDLSFFQRCMMGVSEVAAAKNYDLIISVVYDNDISQLERLVRNRKVDGIVLARTLIKDQRVTYLTNNDIPFVVIGSSPDKKVIQIDNDHISACKEMTSILVMKGIKKMALIGGDANHVVNQTRREGFESGLREQSLKVDEDNIYMDCDTNHSISKAVDECMSNHVECIVCMDDRICCSVLNKFRRDGISVPGDVKLASFYNSSILESNEPAITSLQYDPKKLGIVACKTLFNYIEGRKVQKKVLLNYEVVLKESTK